MPPAPFLKAQSSSNAMIESERTNWHCAKLSPEIACRRPRSWIAIQYSTLSICLRTFARCTWTLLVAVFAWPQLSSGDCAPSLPRAPTHGQWQRFFAPWIPSAGPPAYDWQTRMGAAKSTSVRANKLFEAKGREIGGGADHYPAGLRQDPGKHLSRPEELHPAAADRTRQAIAHSVFESELKRPSIDPNRLEHMLDLGPRIRRKTGPTQE